mmetsp:Transcript_88135/g.244642  ORF Transcript_88135/g.244642 Transcript_88135/m.244642 type:complete len:130 (+) Transcript_88135:108-497(+)
MVCQRGANNQRPAAVAPSQLPPRDGGVRLMAVPAQWPAAARTAVHAPLLPALLEGAGDAKVLRVQVTAEAPHAVALDAEEEAQAGAPAVVFAAWAARATGLHTRAEGRRADEDTEGAVGGAAVGRVFTQ